MSTMVRMNVRKATVELAKVVSYVDRGGEKREEVSDGKFSIYLAFISLGQVAEKAGMQPAVAGASQQNPYRSTPTISLLTTSPPRSTTLTP